LSIKFFKKAVTVFWDFDGVIKDSVEIKSDAFEEIFLPFGKEIAKKVKFHHEENGGMSRYHKLPIYLSWAGQEVSAELTTEYAEKFAQLVKQKVINSEWIAGVLEYLENNCNRQYFFLITATPQQEITEIISILKINHFFKEIVGSPTKKNDAIKQILSRYKVAPEQALMIGDSKSDYSAAMKSKISFVLRKTKLNKKLQQQLDCEMIDNYYE
jgi:phosphoglycolate phosphatase-like HAD superfamily hydrolase